MIKHIELVNKWGKTLRGYLDYPENCNGEIIIFFHGFTGNKTEHAHHFRNLSRLLSAEGYASMRLDFSGNGESDGEFKDFTMDTMMSEACQMVDYAFNIEGIKKVSILGFSMGGGVASMITAIYGNKINKAILWSAAANICEHIKLYYENGTKLENGNSLHGYWELSKEMYESCDRYDTTKGIEKFTNPVLLCHGNKDKAIDYMYSMKYAELYPNAFVHIINNAGHGYDVIAERDELYKKTIDFLNFFNDINK